MNLQEQNRLRERLIQIERTLKEFAERLARLEGAPIPQPPEKRGPGRPRKP